MPYFPGFQDVLDLSEATAVEPTRPLDTGGDVLPFDHLDDRRFEILVYRLKYVELTSAGSRITLMQGVGERGRDVIVHSSSGVLTEIVQCKKYGERFTAPALRKELAKLALHHHLDSSILGDGPVTYELWCPGGLTEQAANLLASWPHGWTSAAVREDALEVIETYAAFEAVEWDRVGDRVVEEFKARCIPRHVTGIELSRRVRLALPIYEAFFQGKVVMQREDALDAFRQIMTEEGFTQLTDKDARHIVDRINAFPPERRLVHMCGYVMGLPPELVSKFNREEYGAFATHAMHGTTGMIQVVMKACARLTLDAGRDFRERVQPSNRALTQVLAKTMNLSMLARLIGMTMNGLKLQPGLEAYSKLSVRERLEHHVRETWDMYQRCLAGYDPAKHRFGSDEEFRSRIATHAINGARSKEEFEAELLLALDEHQAELEASFSRSMQLVPEEILLVTDTMTIFDSKWLLGRMVETTNLLEKLRGSAIIPE